MIQPEEQETTDDLNTPPIPR